MYKFTVEFIFIYDIILVSHDIVMINISLWEEYIMKFYVCEHCGNIIEYLKDVGVPVMCCGQKMTELIPGESDGAFEKHVPVTKIEGNKVMVEIGAVEHPMVEKHYIEWIVIETKKGCQRVNLSYTDAPKAEFVLSEGDEYVATYEYCNLHGLWKGTDK